MAIQFKNIVDVFEQRTGAVATDAYTLTVSTEQASGATPNPGTGGLKVQYYSVSSGTTHGFGLVAGSSSSDFLTSGPMHFYTNSDLDTKNATGLAMILDNSQNLGIGVTSITAGNRLEVAGGTIGIDDYIVHNSDTDTKFGFVANDNFAITTNNAERLRVTSGGSVGIGTNNPGAKLDVNGNIRLAQYGYIYFGSNSSNQLSLSNSLSGSQITQSGSGNLELQSASNDIHLKAGGLTKAVLTSSGDFGIGLTNPAEKLHVIGSVLIEGSTTELKVRGSGSYDTANITMGNAAKNDSFSIDTRNDPGGNFTDLIFDSYQTTGTSKITLGANNISLSTAGSSRVTINSSGNVGIATTGPSQKLEVNGNVTANRYYGNGSTTYYVDPNNTTQSAYFAGDIRITDSNYATIKLDSTSSYPGASIVATKNGSESPPYGSIDWQENPGFAGSKWSHRLSYSPYTESLIQLPSSSSYDFYIKVLGSNRITIDSSTGDVGIATTNPRAKLDVNGGIRMADDTSAAASTNVGTLRYRTSGNNSYVDMCMQTGASTYEWVNIVQNSW
jgi:hypothetical protein